MIKVNVKSGVTMRSYKDIIRYVEDQSQDGVKVLSVKTEQSFDDLGHIVNVWNVKTDIDGSWWVVEGEGSPMNLYPQDAYYFSADEVYSFHIGIMERMLASNDNYNPEDYVRAVSLDAEIAPILFRKLKNIALLIDTAIEIEDFQAIGVQCREILVELGNNIYLPKMAGQEEQPKESDFKRKAELFIQYHIPGKENKDYRNIIKRMTEGTWDYAAKIVHSRNSTFYDVSTCVSLTTSIVTMYENVRLKYLDFISKCKCKNCQSKKLGVTNRELSDDEKELRLELTCEECGDVQIVICKIKDEEDE